MRNKCLLNMIMKKTRQVEITVKGTSMQPLLYENDRIMVKQEIHYTVGDILVYFYKDEGIIVHRLLKINDRFYCKGDNAFRVEDIEERDILGRAVLVNGHALREWPEWKLALSYEIGRLFRVNNYCRESTMQSNAYKLYADLVLHDSINQKYCLSSSVTVPNAIQEKQDVSLINFLAQPHSALEIAEKWRTIYGGEGDKRQMGIEAIICYGVLNQIIVPL